MISKHSKKSAVSQTNGLDGWVFYDGGCPLCAGLARRFERTLRRCRFGLASFETRWARARLGLSPDEALTEMKVLTKDGALLGGADAIVHLARRMWWAGPLCAVARLPFGLALLRRAYRWVAARRHCASGACARPRPAQWPGWLPLIFFPGCVITLGGNLSAWVLMWALAFGIYAGCKWLTWWRNRTVPSTRLRHLGYLFAWPGMDARAFLDCAARPATPPLRDWVWAVLKTSLGILLVWGVTQKISSSLPLVRGWVGLIGLIILLHFGSFHLLSLVWQTAGVTALPIMRAPVFAASLGELWGRRWNLGFHQLADDLVFQPLQDRLGAVGATLAAFLTSGVIHDLVISFPAGGGYGLPTSYFALQAAGVVFERARPGRDWGLGRGVPGRVFALAVAGCPAFWLFHPWFVIRVAVPFLYAIKAL